MSPPTVSTFDHASFALVNHLAAETKLLKTGRKISLGRKDKPLVVNSKKISRDHCEFTVGPCTPDDVVRAQVCERNEARCNRVCSSGKPVVCPEAGDIQCKGQTSVD